VNVYAFIEAEKADRRNVAKACALVEVSRSAFYQWARHEPSLRDQADTELAAKITAIHGGSRGSYGAPRVHAQLVRDGVRCSRKRVARLMATRGLMGRYPRRFRRTTITDVDDKAGSDLVKRNFEVEEINQVWCGDISYVRTWQGWTYLATVIDLASRRVVGYAIADHMRTDLVSDALKMAIEERRPAPGLIFHTDRGCQYTSNEFRDLLKRNLIRQSLSRPGQCWDNAVAESFFSTIKTELIYQHGWPSALTVRQAIFEYIEVFYNRQRLHSTLGYVSPTEYENKTTISNHKRREAA